MGPRCGAYNEAGNHLKISFSAFESSRQTTYTRFLKRGRKGTRCDAYDEAGYKFFDDAYAFKMYKCVLIVTKEDRVNGLYLGRLYNLLEVVDIGLFKPNNINFVRSGWIIYCIVLLMAIGMRSNCQVEPHSLVKPRPSTVSQVQEWFPDTLPAFLRLQKSPSPTESKNAQLFSRSPQSKVPMAGRKVEVLEGELGQLKSNFVKKISEIESQFSSVHEKIDGKFAIVEEMLKKLLDA
ncbi:hypothetical protein IEQ34_008693 [Dendrobium chrysotoxum]|uniref:Uncharacterized protein n=1 Tax=Dendrobium chrysotoxum TaxID=161865 RepID=A0AAV7GZR3_DENCH|nr:hypothetical protein IEQ34_008693 [Dendrobium chrysotoxum]